MIFSLNFSKIGGGVHGPKAIMSLLLYVSKVDHGNLHAYTENDAIFCQQAHTCIHTHPHPPAQPPLGLAHMRSLLAPGPGRLGPRLGVRCPPPTRNYILRLCVCNNVPRKNGEGIIRCSRARLGPGWPTAPDRARYAAGALSIKAHLEAGFPALFA